MSQVPQAIGVGDQRRKRVPIWVLLVALALSMPLALQGATQYVAHQYGYHARSASRSSPRSTGPGRSSSGR